MAALKWAGTKQRDDLKRCPWCGTQAVQQVRLADNETDMQFRIGCGNSFCAVAPNTQPFAALEDAECAWQERGDGPPRPSSPTPGFTPVA